MNQVLNSMALHAAGGGPTGQDTTAAPISPKRVGVHGS